MSCYKIDNMIVAKAEVNDGTFASFVALVFSENLNDDDLFEDSAAWWQRLNMSPSNLPQPQNAITGWGGDLTAATDTEHDTGFISEAVNFRSVSTETIEWNGQQKPQLVIAAEIEIE